MDSYAARPRSHSPGNLRRPSGTPSEPRFDQRSGGRLAARDGGELPLLVVADRQTAGRGRATNRWWTGPGALAFSLLVDGRTVGARCGRSPLVALAAAMAVVDAVAPLLPGQSLGIHWPNDVFVGGRKLAGILIEVLPDRRHVIGIGLNTNNSLADAPAELQSTAATLRDLGRTTYDQTEILVQLLKHLEGEFHCLCREPQTVAARADALCLQRGQTLTLQEGGRTISRPLPGHCRRRGNPAGHACRNGSLFLGNPRTVARSVPLMTKCYFVSDLHLFANRSRAHRYLEDISRAASPGGRVCSRRRHFRFSVGPDSHSQGGRASLPMAGGAGRFLSPLPLPPRVGQSRLPPGLDRPAGRIGAVGFQSFLAPLLPAVGQQCVFARRRGQQGDGCPHAGRGAREVARPPPPRPVRQPALRRRGADAAAQAAAAPGLRQTDRRAADPEIPWRASARGLATASATSISATPTEGSRTIATAA